MAVFDVVVNNADRKGGHVLPMPDGHRHGVDHGLTFHLEHKLRTVLWGWVGEPLTDDEASGLRRLAAALDGVPRRDPGRPAGRGRGGDRPCAASQRLLARGEFPGPATSSYPVIPWPPF